MSQEEFADICGLDRTYIGGIERGERNVALVNIEKIAKGLRISVSELFQTVRLIPGVKIYNELKEGKVVE